MAFRLGLFNGEQINLIIPNLIIVFRQTRRNKKICVRIIQLGLISPVLLFVSFFSFSWFPTRIEWNFYSYSTIWLAKEKTNLWVNYIKSGNVSTNIRKIYKVNFFIFFSLYSPKYRILNDCQQSSYLNILFLVYLLSHPISPFASARAILFGYLVVVKLVRYKIL